MPASQDTPAEVSSRAHLKPPDEPQAESRADSVVQKDDSDTKDDSKEERIRYRTEYRGARDQLVQYTTESRQKVGTQSKHKGTVFDVVDVNLTLDTKDTRRSDQNSENPAEKETTSLDSGSIPNVQWRGRQYIRIYSRAIINALQAVVDYYPDQELVETPLDIKWPYAVLVHHWDALKAFRKEFEISEATAEDCSVGDTVDHLGLLLDFLEEEMGARVREEYQRWQQPIPKASFEMLWLLLKPGVDTYRHVEEDGSKQICVISGLTFFQFNETWDKYTVKWWLFDNDATSIRPISRQSSIARFHGEKSIQELRLFPCEYYEHHNTRKPELIQRGRLFTQLQRQRCMYFDGESMDTPRQKYKGYVMVDAVQAHEDEKIEVEDGAVVDQRSSHLPLCSCKRCSNIDCERKRPPKFQGYRRIAFEDTPKMTDHQYFLCTEGNHGFILETKQWKGLYMEGFKEPQWNLRLMDSLVLKAETKQMLQKLSRLYLHQTSDSSTGSPVPKRGGQAEARPWTADYITAKGKGLVILLHGKPGVGKTYTAECVAHSLQRPLLSITCADIGTHVHDVEKNLRRWFNLARLWNAVLLIDEADIYFETRQTQDLERNNLVASFLRAVEYYDGLLFLTTNRIGSSDEAVWSRIQITIYYNDFNDTQRQKIWQTYFDKLEEERGDEIRVLESTKEYVETNEALKSLNWNGREIRNAFQVAVNLAQTEETKDSKGRFQVKREHIMVTVDLLKDFRNYMESLHKKSSSQRAQIDKIRYDAYNASQQTDNDEEPY